MNIYLSGYFDRNFGDDMLFRIVAANLRQHEFYLEVLKDEYFIPYENEPNMHKYSPGDNVKFDMGLTVTGSGFIVRGPVSVVYFLKEERERRRSVKGLKTAVIGCNIGPINGKLGELLVNWKLRSFDTVSVRDAKSFDYMRKKLPKIHSELHPDLVFAMPDEWIPDIESEGALGISAYRSVSGSNLSFYKAAAKTADAFIERAGKKVLLFAFDMELENDLCAAYTILSFMRHGDGAEVIAHCDDGSNIIRNLKRCGCVITARFHMAIMAIRLGIPFVPTAYSPKTVNALRDLGYTGEIFDIKNLSSDALSKAVENVKPFEARKNLMDEARGHIECIKKMTK